MKRKGRGRHLQRNRRNFSSNSNIVAHTGKRGRELTGLLSRDYCYYEVIFCETDSRRYVPHDTPDDTVRMPSP